ncbi:Aminoglycoside/hydroxyurea antibiotic resistance kinase [Falsiruegeria litorea R37]|uniref:Aminoglycoside/hydroxyurea antibiotic resistance kinase n=2 Tax=Falsiruegeria litorea TaxID=1280831 RepID=A0A1Y5SEE1_9RHOB|nr:Aminoglycoside/hydroxyurea antibiotic resistance kinase [Falsiruegeria litorea R37]
MHHTLQETLTRLGLADPEPLAETVGARLWRVRQTDGTQAVLKLHKRADRGNEAAGAALLRAWTDRGAVRILTEAGPAVVMEWLDGPSLANVAIQDPKRAAQTLAHVSRRLHRDPVQIDRDLPRLSLVLAPLLRAVCSSDCPPSLRSELNEAIALARDLLATGTDKRPLHGDLHHANVILTDSGARVLDAKGFHGDISYELANAFRHPYALHALIRDPDWIEWCRGLYAGALNVPEPRLAQWAAVKCALSIVWRAKGPITRDPEADLLSALLDQARAVSTNRPS